MDKELAYFRKRRADIERVEELQRTLSTLRDDAQRTQMATEFLGQKFVDARQKLLSLKGFGGAIYRLTGSRKRRVDEATAVDMVTRQRFERAKSERDEADEKLREAEVELEALGHPRAEVAELIQQQRAKVSAPGHPRRQALDAIEVEQSAALKVVETWRDRLKVGNLAVYELRRLDRLLEELIDAPAVVPVKGKRSSHQNWARDERQRRIITAERRLGMAEAHLEKFREQVFGGGIGQELGYSEDPMNKVPNVPGDIGDHAIATVVQEKTRDLASQLKLVMRALERRVAKEEEVFQEVEKRWEAVLFGV